MKLNFRNRALLGGVMLGVMLSAGAMAQTKTPPMSTADRQEYLDKLVKILPNVPSWDEWQKKTGTLPPDFNALPRHNAMPDPMKFNDGRMVTTAAQWPARRAEILKDMEKYVWGTVPPTPKVDHVTLVDEKHEDGYTVRNVRLEFGPGSKGTLRVRTYVPDGTGPFPVMISTSLQGWATSLVRRGYIAVGYAGNDGMDDAAPLAALYPDYDFALLPRRAWCAGIVINYLESLQHVDMKHIGIFGYSRDGKMVTIAGILNPRITAVIAGSTGVGGVLPWRASGERGFGEGIESTTRSFPTWFAPQLRYFAGREDRLPVDGNELAALMAPRSILMEWGHNDQVSNTWGCEQTYYTSLPVYKLLGVPNNLGTFRLPGFHGTNDEEADIDWMDQQFGRAPRTWTNNLTFQWDWNTWKTTTKTTVDVLKYPKQSPDELMKSSTGAAITSTSDWEKKSEDLHKTVVSMLGTEPPIVAQEARAGFGGPGGPGGRRGGPGGAAGAPTPGPGGYMPNAGQVTPNLPAWVIGNGGNSYGWLTPEKDEAATRHIMFGGIAGDIYYPKNAPAGKKLPTVVWLHGYSYPLGYMWVYHSDLHPILALVHAGYAVLAYDQSGFGSRLTEVGNFYERFPKWSHMGRMVEDAHAAVDALTKDPQVDADHIYLFGYSMGGTVAIYEAALDSRVKGIVSVAGFTPMRTDVAAHGDGGVARYAIERGEIPKLGYFIGHESQIPYDYQDLLGMIAPRPVLIVEPQLDRDAFPAEVEGAVNQAKQVYSLYNAGDKIAVQEPWDYNRLPNNVQDEAVKWMKSNMP